MAIPECNLDTRTRENNNNKSKMLSLKEKRALLERQEISLAKALAGNNPKFREKALKRLKKWMENRSQAMPFSEEDFMKIWKGLFYSMWMSDKPLVQEMCAEKISQLVHLPLVRDGLLFYKCGLNTFINEWFGLDQLRLDKFLMLFRRLLRQALFLLEQKQWDKQSVIRFNDIIQETVLNTDKVPPVGLSMHYLDIFLEELAKVSDGGITDCTISVLMKPFIKFIAWSKDDRLIDYTRNHIFIYLMKQSDEGLEYQERFNVWRSQRFAGGSIDCIQKEVIEGDSDGTDDETVTGSRQNEEKILDPRAGNVDVLLPQLKFSPRQIVKLFEEVKFHPNTTVKSRKVLGTLITQFELLGKGHYPLGIKKITLPNYDRGALNLKKAAKELIRFDKKLMGINNRKGKKRKHEFGISVNGDEEEDVLDCEAKSTGFKLNNGVGSMEKKKTKERPMKKRVKSPIDEPDASTESEKTCGLKFKRNSGTWLVTDNDNDKTGTLNGFMETTSKTNGDTSTKKKSKKRKVQIAGAIAQTQLFAASEWDEPLMDGEVEYFVPSKKSKSATMKISSTSLVTNPFSSSKKSIDIDGTPSKDGMKKVNINLKLNKSQEIHEHQQQIRSSPGIPFDANKRPTKPLLKSKVASPINPFYFK